MTTEEALKSLSTHGFVYEPWRTPDEVWMAAWRWALHKEWWQKFTEKVSGGPVFDLIPVDLIGSPDFLVELAEFLEGR